MAVKNKQTKGTAKAQTQKPVNKVPAKTVKPQMVSRSRTNNAGQPRAKKRG